MTFAYGLSQEERDVYRTFSVAITICIDEKCVIVSYADQNDSNRGIHNTYHAFSPGHFRQGGMTDGLDVVTFVLEGQLKFGKETEEILTEGDALRFTQKDGAQHDYYNASDECLLRFLSIDIPAWTPQNLLDYEKKTFDVDQRQPLRLIASQRGRRGSLALRSDVDVYVAQFDERASVRHRLAPGRVAWVQAVRGSFEVNGYEIPSDTALKFRDVGKLRIVPTSEDAELVLFDMAPSLAA
jgi:quercetin 2,3-dioxygenase